MVIMFTIYAFLLGSILASFFGVVIYRVPNNMSIINPPSFCPNCNHKIKWYENIPIFSFIFLKGKCSNCKASIGWFSFIYELLGGIIFALTFLVFKFSYIAIFMLVIVAILYLIAGYDFKTNTILDICWIGLLIVSLGLYAYRVFALKENFLEYLLGAVIGFTFFFLVKIIGKAIKKVDCLGMGDVILMGIAGLIIGYKGLLLAILIASVTGSIIEIILLKTNKRKKDSEIAFCPYLVLGILIAMLYGTNIINWYLGLVM